MPLLVYDDWRGGYWAPGGTNISAPSSGLITAQNIEYFIGADAKVWILGRRGQKRLNTSTALAGTIKSMWRLYRKMDGPFTIVQFSDSQNDDKVTAVHDSDNNGILEALSGSADHLGGATERFQWVTFPEKDAAYGVNGDNGLKKYDGSTISEITLSGAFTGEGTKIGPYITLHKNRMVVTDSAHLTDRLYFFDLNSDSSVPATNQLIVEHHLGGKITGMVPWHEMLLIFKETGVFRFTGGIEFLEGSDLSLVSNYGCTAPFSIKVMPDGIIYLSRDGLRITDGQNSRGLDLSPAIRSLFVSPGTQNIYKDAQASFSLRKNQYRIKLNATSDVHVLQRLELVDGPVWLWSTATNMTNITTFADGEDTNDNGRVYAGDSAGKFWELDVGLDDNDNGAITDWSIVVKTPFTLVSDAEQFLYGRMIRVGIEYRGPSTATVRGYYDDRPAAAHDKIVGRDLNISEMQTEEREFDELKGIGRRVSTEVTLFKGSYEHEIHQVNTMVAVRGIRTRRRLAV